MGVGESAPFGALLRAARLAAVLSQEALAETAGLSARAISDLERGINRHPRRATLDALTRALDLPPSERARWDALWRAARDPNPVPGIARGNLPAPPNALVGRETDVAQLRDLLRGSDARLVTLTGPGGVGKTRLALAAAAVLRDDFSDGVWFVDLSPVRDPDLVISSVAQVVGVREAAGRPLLNTLVGGLRSQGLLLVLDNCEHVLAAAPDVAALVAGCPGVKVLATSRERLRLRGEWEVPVGPLALRCPDASSDVVALARAPAVVLFVERARAAKPGFALTADNAAAVAEVCRRLDGLPLAIELAAARVRALPPATLAARLVDRLTLLAGGELDRPARHRALAATISWSHDLLNDGERALFRRVAVFDGGWSLDAAEGVCADEDAGGLPSEGVLEVLVQLVEKSLVVEEPGPDGEARYRLLETVRPYARERLAASGEAEAVRVRHAAHFLRRGTAIVGDAERSPWGTPLARMAGEVPNFRTAVECLAERGHLLAAYCLGDALGRVMEQAGQLRDAAALLAGLLSRPAPAPARVSGARVDALLVAFHVAEEQGDLRAARALLNEVLAIQRARDDASGVAEALSWLGGVARNQGAMAEAQALLQESLELYRPIGDAGAVAMALDRLGTVAHAVGDLSAAQRAYAESEALIRARPDPRLLSWSLHNQALLALDRGDGPLASALARESAARRCEVGDSPGLVYTLALLAAILAGEGRAHGALRLAGAVQAACTATGCRLMLIYQERLDAATAAARRSLDHATALGSLAEGRALTVEQALATALAETGSPIESDGLSEGLLRY